MKQMSPSQPAQIPKSLRGSRARCLKLTEGTNIEIAARLTSLVTPYGYVDPHRHQWMPKGQKHPAEAKLGESTLFLNTQQREEITAWWLTVRRGANTPNWDIVSQATIEGTEGLVLVEAKAHKAELSQGAKTNKDNASDNSKLNHQRIAGAISDANHGLNAIMPGWDLSSGSHYQLANRFAWAWKIASMGVPVILVYLGFLEATEMSDCGQLLSDIDDWQQVMATYTQGKVPPEAWRMKLSIPYGLQAIPLSALIRSW